MPSKQAEALVRYNLADLHTHSICSDGMRTPTEAVQEAHDAGLRALSLTDHDTVEGTEEAINAGKDLGVEVIPGSELSAHVGDREVHLLAYMIDWKDKRLKENLNKVHEARRQRGFAIVERLTDMGISITVDEILTQANGSPLGRPHIASVLVKKGVVANKDEAFLRFLGDRAPAFQSKPLIPAKDVITLVHQSGGIVVLAHPGHNLPDLVFSQLVSAGLDGIEIYHPSHQPSQIEFYSNLAVQNKLVMSGGSDSHGDENGTSIGDFGIGYEAIGKMRERAERYSV